MSIIQEGNVVYDNKYKEVFTYSRGDRFVIDRLRLATDEEKIQLLASGKTSICLATAEEQMEIERQDNQDSDN